MKYKFENEDSAQIKLNNYAVVELERDFEDVVKLTIEGYYFNSESLENLQVLLRQVSRALGVNSALEVPDEILLWE